MIRFYRALAKVITIYALLHPFVYLGAQWYEMRRMQDRAESIMAPHVDAAGTSFEAKSPDGMPLLFQELIYERVFSIRNILLALVMAVGLLGVGAIFHIAANSRPQLADADARDLQRPPGDSDAG